MPPQYPDAPNSWYGAILVSAIITAMVIIYKTDSTLPWWVLGRKVVCHSGLSLPQVGLHRCVFAGRHLYFVLHVTLRYNWPCSHHPTFRPNDWRLFAPRKANG
jgi:hypothetical protein